MAWTSPPTFVDGSGFSAGQLNILSQDVEHLHGVQQGVNIPFASLYSPNGVSFDGNNCGWDFLHLHRYLHFRARVIDLTVSLFRVMYGTTVLYSDATTRSAGHVYSDCIDLNPFGFVVGNFYKIHVDMTSVYMGKISLDHLLQSDQTTI